jgi:hypothetical protein
LAKRIAILGSLLLCTALASVRAQIPDDYRGKPFADTFHKAGAPSIPGIVQCSLYDLGGEGVAYHDTDSINNGSGKLNLETGHQRPHAGEYIWHFRKDEAVDLSFVKDWADLNHPNLVTPHINQFYIGWTEDGEWCNYTVNVARAGAYQIKALYAFQTNTVTFDLNGDPASIGGTFSTGGSVIYSDSNGIATTAYIPSDRPSPTNGVTIRACYSTGDFTAPQCPNFTTTTITVVSDPLSVTIGSNNVILLAPNKLTYQRQFVILVVDASGRAKGNVDVVPSIERLRSSVAPADLERAAILLARADKALYRAKTDGRNCVRILLRDPAPTPASFPPQPPASLFLERRDGQRTDRRQHPGFGRRKTDVTEEAGPTSPTDAVADPDTEARADPDTEARSTPA